MIRLSPKIIAVAAGAAILFGLGYYFYSVGTFSRLLSRDQSAALAIQEEHIAELEKQNKEAERKFAALMKRAAESDRRADAAALAASEERRRVQAWATKYAEIKARARDLIDTPEKADRAMKQLGW